MANNMTYLYRFLIKVILSIILILQSFSKSTYSLYMQGGGYWVLPLITVIFVVWTIVEGTSLFRSKKWYRLVKDKDERTEVHSHRAGYLTFWINMIGTTLMFVYYSYTGTNALNTLDFVGIMFILNIILYIALKIYYIHNK